MYNGFQLFFLFIIFLSSAKGENISFYILTSTELAFLILVIAMLSLLIFL